MRGSASQSVSQISTAAPSAASAPLMTIPICRRSAGRAICLPVCVAYEVVNICCSRVTPCSPSPYQ